MWASQMYNTGNLAQILRALALSAAASRSGDATDAAFRAGYAVAIAAVATAVGVPAAELHLPDVRRELTP